MAGEDEKTVVNDKAPSGAPPASVAASAPSPSNGAPAKAPEVAAAPAAPVADAPVADAPVADAPVADAPVAAAPVADAPVEPPTERMPSAPPPAPDKTQRMQSVPPPAAEPVSVPPPARRPSTTPAGPPSVAPASTLVVRQARGSRRSGDDLISDLFEACSDLGFVGDPLEGAEFILTLLLEMLHAKVALVSFYDINAREFVLVRQGVLGNGEQTASLPNAALTRSSEFTPHVLRTMRAGSAMVLSGNDTDAVAEDGRWRALGIVPVSLVCAPVRSGGRYLGLLEIADPDDGKPFTDGDGHAVTYIAEQFGEYLAQREVVTDSERVSRPRLSQLARR
jgi:hypothetical protein